MFQKVACNSLVVYVGKAVPVYIHARKKGLRYPGACRFREKGNSGNRRKADRTALCQTFYKFEIKIMHTAIFFQSNLNNV